jgi:glycogen operon protein
MRPPRLTPIFTKALSDTLRVRAPLAEAVWLCTFDGDTEDRVSMVREGEVWHCPAPPPGTHYAFRADGTYAPEHNLWFDPTKALVDPLAERLDAPFRYDPRLSEFGADTATLAPKAIWQPEEQRTPSPPQQVRGGLIYEVNVWAFTLNHPEVPAKIRGTVAALSHPTILTHLKRLGVQTLELMPITAWIDERHLPPLGLENRWGYNPVTFKALDPRLCPGGPEELRNTADALHSEGIGLVLDLVFNHTGESDIHGPTLSYRGLEPEIYRWDNGLVNDTGCGNTVACDHPGIIHDVVEALRHFAGLGVDGFRFDLAPVLGRSTLGFNPQAPLLRALQTDPFLKDRTMIMEPWDIGPGGYQLGQFEAPALEWNDRFRDDLRRFWRGEGRVGDLATRLAGSSDVFSETTRSVNFVAAHDGFTLWDTTSYLSKHNLANGENNRDGHGENLSWNHGIEGPADAQTEARRRADVAALLTLTLLARGTPMIGMGDASRHSQNGNNNAYCQSFPLDWSKADTALETFCGQLSALRQSLPDISGQTLLSDDDVSWLGADGHDPDWNGRTLAMKLGPITLCINGTQGTVDFSAAIGDRAPVIGEGQMLPPMCVHVFREIET